ncbi:MAG: hypothetical protein D6682_04355 [Zetaproteobacteria bacterium]|nr:MAG: hypothetical protein D6682_04355 [Zetaproteobacteria bacterium]
MSDGWSKAVTLPLRMTGTLLLAALLLAAAPASAAIDRRQTVAFDHGRLSATLRDAPLRQVMRQLATRAGLNLYLGKSVQGRVSASFHDLPLERALRRILRQRNYILTYDGAGRPRQLWLLNRGEAAYDLIHGYRDAPADRPSSDDAPRSTEGGRQQPNAAAPLHGAMAAAVVRDRMKRSREQARRASTGYYLIQQHRGAQLARLRRALATAPSDKRPAIVRKLAAIEQGQSAVQPATAAKQQQIAASAQLQKLARLRNTALLPTRQIARRQALKSRQQALQAMARQQQLALLRARRAQAAHLSTIRKQPTPIRWGVR